MRSVVTLLAAAGLAIALAACAQNPVAQQATVDTRYDPTRSDTMLAVNFTPSAPGPDGAQVGGLRTMVETGRRAQRDEFVVVSDGTGGPMQQARAQRVGQVLSNAGARWVSTSVEPAMAMGPNTVVVVRSEYLLGFNNCPNFNPATTANPNEAAMPGFGCADSYNMGQMLARPRDAKVGRSAGPADGTVNAAAIARYRDGKVPALNTTGVSTTGQLGTGAGTSTGGGGGGGTGSSSSGN
jgi:type IV pilus biogenesis protein CpaD/CtpE